MKWWESCEVTLGSALGMKFMWSDLMSISHETALIHSETCKTCKLHI